MDVELRGYQTTSTVVTAIRRQPCPTHHTAGWLDQARAGEGSPYDPACSECAAMPPLVDEYGVVDWTTNDPLVIGLDEAGGAIVEPNPLKRLAHRVRRSR